MKTPAMFSDGETTWHKSARAQSLAWREWPGDDYEGGSGIGRCDARTRLERYIGNRWACFGHGLLL